MATKITFHPEDHKYFDQNMVEFTSITTLLSQEFVFNSREIAEKVSKISSSKYHSMSVERILEFWDNSADLGTMVHEALEDYIVRDTWPSDPCLVPLVEQFSKLRFNGDLLSETLVFSEEYRLAGTIDLMEVFPDKIYLFDFKTSNKISEDKLMKFSLQLELYRRMAEKQFNKPVIIIGILWFEDFVVKRGNTKLKLIRPLHLPDVVDDILAKRKLEIERK